MHWFAQSCYLLICGKEKGAHVATRSCCKEEGSAYVSTRSSCGNNEGTCATRSIDTVCGLPLSSIVVGFFGHLFFGMVYLCVPGDYRKRASPWLLQRRRGPTSKPGYLR